MATFIDTSTNEEFVKWDEILTREIWYIHGTTSNPDRWNGHTKAVNACNIIAMGPKSKWEKQAMQKQEWIDKYCNFKFSWYGETINPATTYNGYFNDVLDRKRASEKLVKELESRKGKVDEIVLIGHSHGGNIALQAANNLSKMFKHLYILTIATPAQNKREISSEIELPELNLIDKIGNPHTKNPAHAYIYHYTNPEHPDNIQNWGKVTHLALWNNRDSVDGIALALEIYRDLFSGVKGMTFYSDYFTNTHTKNVEFDIKNDFSSADKEAKIMTMWRYELACLSNTLYEYLVDGYDLNYIKMPALRSYDEYKNKYSYKYTPQEEYYLRPRMTSFQTSGKEPVYVGNRLRKAQLQRLFKNLIEYGSFLNSIDYCTQGSQNLFVSSINKQRNSFGFYVEKSPLITNRYPVFHQIETYAKSIEEQYEYNTNISKAGNTFPTHGFDLAHPEEILKAIKEKRIIPFARVKKKQGNY